MRVLDPEIVTGRKRIEGLFVGNGDWKRRLEKSDTPVMLTKKSTSFCDGHGIRYRSKRNTVNGNVRTIRYPFRGKKVQYYNDKDNRPNFKRHMHMHQELSNRWTEVMVF
jgi:hypothetical protein